MAVRTAGKPEAVDDVLMRPITNRLSEKPWRRIHLLRRMAHALHARAPAGTLDPSLHEEVLVLSKNNPVISLSLVLMSALEELKRLQREVMGEDWTLHFIRNGSLGFFGRLGRWRDRDMATIMQHTESVARYVCGGRINLVPLCPPAFRPRFAAHAADLHVRIIVCTSI